MHRRSCHRDVAADQRGLLTVRQAAATDLTTEGVRHEVATGRLERLGLRVLRVEGSAPDSEQRALAAALDCGGLLSHVSAAAWWGLPGFLLEPLEVCTARTPRASATPLARVHRIRSLTETHGVVLRGVPVVRPELLVLQLCASVHPDRAERSLDRLGSERVLSGPSTRRRLDEVAASGVRGVRTLRQLLDDRGPSYVPPASGLEARFAQILREAGLAPMERQVDLGDAARWCGRVDFADPPTPVGHRALIEIQSERYHTALVDLRSDHERLHRLRAGGFVVGTVDDFQVWHARAEVLAEVRRVRSEVRRLDRHRL